MKTLALELSSGRGSVAWLADQGDCDVRTFANDRKHSGMFFRNLQDLSTKYGSPDVIVVGLGPGSYTGVRIAIAAAIGFRLTARARLLGLPSVCAMETDECEFCVIGDARRESFFLGCVRNGKLVNNFSLHTGDELLTKIVDADVPVYASEFLPAFPNVVLAYPSAARLAELTRERMGEMIDSEILEPIYLREPHITMPRRVNNPGMQR